MNLALGQETLWLFGGVTGVLAGATTVGRWLTRMIVDPTAREAVENFNTRVRAWWLMCAIFGVSLLIGRHGPVILFGATSFLALREFMTLTPTRRGDHRSLLWIFYIVTPFQYLLVGVEWVELFMVLIPVCAFLLIPTRGATAGDHERFLERNAEIQWGLMVCVYCVSHAPALLMLKIPGYEGENFKLLFFFVLVDQISDVLQYIWGKCFGKNPIAPRISPNKTWEGFFGGIGSATLIGAALWRITPFTPLQAAAMSLVIALMGFAGGLTMSAVKRDRGIKDYGTLIKGHGGVLDRIDSICFAAPVFFHLTRFFFT